METQSPLRKAGVFFVLVRDRCLVVFAAGWRRTTMWTTRRPCCASGSLKCRVCITMWSGDHGSGPGETCWCSVTVKPLYTFIYIFVLLLMLLCSQSCFCVSEYEDEDGPKHWTDPRYEYVMKLRQAALDTARQMWADYILVRHWRGSETLTWIRGHL